jgi:hypothetical protein
VENWVRIPILISFDCVLEGSRNDNLTKVMMETLTIGANGVNVFQGTLFGAMK